VSITVVAIDNETGERAERTVEAGNYVLIVVEPCHLAGEQHHASGTSVLTLKGRNPNLLATAVVETDPA
jgi:hypothetical protein